MQWREQRLQAFTEMVSAAAAWTNLVALHRHSILKEGLSVDRFNLLHDAFKAVGHAWSSVELVGSEKVLARARSLFKIVQEEFFAVLQEDLDLLDQRDRKSVLSGIEELKAVFRHDLGVRCSDTEPVSRERPFETTS
ncbi:hypothetical protein LX86_008238 [Lentzea aerocolonigenes]|nr:hypothetical protein [Lentzea aerocolonigenes]